MTVLSHIANVAKFSAQIATKIKENNVSIDVHKVWLMGWLRDIGRVAWGIATEQKLTEITEKYGHHGLLGYDLLIGSGVPEELSVIAMTHIGSGVSADETREINGILGRDVFPIRDWYASTLEEKVVVIGDKIPGWNNTIVSHYEAQLRGDGKGNKIYGWLPNQAPLWERFWSFKSEVDEAARQDVLELFDPGLLASEAAAYKKLPSPKVVLQMDF